MPSRTLLLRFPRQSPQVLLPTARRRCYSAKPAAASSDQEPLIRVTDLPAPNTGHIRILELNRPSARNAISRALLQGLRREIDDVHAQYDAETGDEIPVQSWNQRFGGAAGESSKGPTRAVIIASAVESCFCAGADLKERRGFTQEETDAFLITLRATFATLAALPVPTISAISSLALGGGLELALATHFRVLSSNAVIGLPETRLGILPGAGGTHRLPALIGIGRARDLILTGRRVSAPEAYFLGIADRLVEVLPEEGEGDKTEAVAAGILARARRDVLSEGVRLATEICEGGPVAVRAALQAVQRPHESVENAMYERVVKTEDRNEALRAFGEKRKPVFTGR
ncbi:ClpP/crotonase [Cryphonectria parasitica EP155]|uniref:ClpP/crotonase n=1 Tax=Cryphonectria parasitica (strain ATCC 38755 / EP155) TaxID=660469 RepID=A0A9P4XXS0_CRYP1|nr:ClpP/crotonase [Cryphonectria parasitica EP155]KAF3763297.1 ClpP/crotonase [Cryphonectria parasitica EP155]